MARIQISIKLDEDLLRRVDEAAEYLKMTRTALIEHAVDRRLKELDGLLDDMASEGSISAKIFDRLSSNETLLHAISRVVASHLDKEDIKAMVERGPVLREEANRRKESKRAAKRGGKR